MWIGHIIKGENEICFYCYKANKKSTLGKGNEAIITFAGKAPFLVGKF